MLIMRAMFAADTVYLVLPNLSNFHDVVESGAPLGFMKMDG